MALTTTGRLFVLVVSIFSINAQKNQGPSKKILVIGGTGRIGTALATHLLQADSNAKVILAGRSPKRGEEAVEEVLKDSKIEPSSRSRVSFTKLDWRDRQALDTTLRNGIDAVVHTAGPYYGESPSILRATIDAKVPVYVDVADPPDFLSKAKAMDEDAKESGTVGLCAAGAFPGLSNVLAMEAAGRLKDTTRVRNIDFSYFTAGLGGSGEVNLLITNDGFGEPMILYRDGKIVQLPTSGKEPRSAKFYITPSDPSYSLVGERKIWNWPFPEAYTVASELGISGSSTVGMGTAPDIWNVILGGLVELVPTDWWKSRMFSYGMAQFSKPMVQLTDKFVGETHAMRIDVEGEDGQIITAVQAHESFRRVVGQCCAEFTLSLLQGFNDDLPSTGVYTPDGLYRDSSRRSKVLKRLLEIPGTLNYGFSDSPNK